MTPQPRPYNSETDYRLVLEAAKEVQQIWIKPIAEKLMANGIKWPGLCYSSTESAAVDKDIGRAWLECGYTNSM